MNEHKDIPMIGYTDAKGAYELRELLCGSPSFGLFAAWDDTGNRYLATTTLRQTESHADLYRKLACDVEGIAPLLYVGHLHSDQPTGFDLMIEQMPMGMPSHLLDKGIAEVTTVVHLGTAIAVILERLHAQQRYLLSLRPQSIYLTTDRKSGIQLMGLVPRADRFYFSAEKPDVTTALAFDDTYVAPEVWLGLEPDNAADVFSLCAVLAFWLRGRSPFNGKGYMGHAKAIMGNKRAYHLPADELGLLLESGLDSEASNRPNITELRKSLQKIADNAY
ncbi:MAG: hypothetical protein KZQ96_03100 [Candidatus Thiodiazotropha sp. (ex Lucinoma borealis)]|nr:hypothetical protein [Candidatus Thiodiazotropha sp. (ex Lucinoma borealis)]